MASMNMKISGVVSITAKPVQTFDGITTPCHCRTVLIKNSDGTTLELDLFGATPETLQITGAG